MTNPELPMSNPDLREFEANLRTLTDGSNVRPFVCEGSPLTCQVFIVGFNPATQLEEPFWNFWDAEYGFCKSEWYEYYKEERRKKPLAPGKTRRATVSNTRRVIEWITEGAAPARCLETNLYAHATAQAKDLVAQHRSTKVFEFLLGEIQPQVLLLHGKDAERHLQTLSTSARIVAVPHLSRGWSATKAQNLGVQLREACPMTRDEQERHL